MRDTVPILGRLHGRIDRRRSAISTYGSRVNDKEVVCWVDPAFQHTVPGQLVLMLLCHR
jgi:hypothetical protein